MGKTTFDDMYQGEQIVGDTREKLEADIRKLYSYRTSTLIYPTSPKKTTDYIKSVSVDTVLGWLDRQAAITERELNALLEEHGVHINHDGLRHFTTVEFERGGCTECANDMGIYADSLCDPLKREIAELQAKVDSLDNMAKSYERRIGELQTQLDRSMPLPLDADGEPIHMGDILHSDEIGIDFECKGLSIDMRGGHEHWKVCYQVTDGISDWTAAKRCHHRRSAESKRRRYSDILESFAHSYNLFMFGSDPAIYEYSSKEELFDEYVAKLEEVVQ